MDNKEIVAAIMSKLRELHPELPERARMNFELDLRRMERSQPRRQRRLRRDSRWVGRVPS